MDLSGTLERILKAPAPADVWQLQGDLLASASDPATVSKARQVAGEFYLYLSDLESKVASRHHSQWAAALATASVTTVSLHELLLQPTDAFRQLLFTGAPALLEIGSALQSVQAWEIEAGVVHHEAAWRLYGELWDISAAMLPGLSPDSRRAQLDALFEPVVSADTPAGAKAGLLVRLFQVVLVLRLAPLFRRVT
jgi:hypothetical protein